MSIRCLSRRALGYAVAVAAVAAGATVSVAAPAQALPTSLNIAISAGGMSPTSAVAVASCPAGTTLVGTGGQILPSSGNVVMTDIIPNVAAGTVTVWGHEKGAFAGNWQVSAAAYCDSQITGVVRVTEASPVDSLDKTVTPDCPAGTTLSGVGYQLQNGNGEVFPDDVRPNLALDGSLITAYENGAYVPTWQLFGYAICANVPAGAAPVRADTAGPFNGVSPKDEVVGCPAGTDPTGAGGELTGALGDVVLDQIMPNPANTQATARGNEFAAANWNVTAYLVCW